MASKLLTGRFTQEQLNNIMEQGMVRQCACPSLLTRLLSDTRSLHYYQQSCLENNTHDEHIHALIASATEQVSQILEAHLSKVLMLEGWVQDRSGEYVMPDQLVILQMEAICSELPLTTD